MKGQKRNSYAARRLGTAFAGALIAAILLFHTKKESEPLSGYGMFSWHAEAIADAQAQDLDACMDKAGVTEIYQHFSNSTSEEEIVSFVERMSKRNVAVYALIGEAEWAYEKERSQLLAQLKWISQYNEGQKKSARIQGVMVDVEPYILKEWDEGDEERDALMKGYVGGMEQAYGYASDQKLELLVCIPTFYDVTNEELLEQLVAQACDGIAVMNYNRTDEYGQIAKEVGFAREYGKEVLCIYELQKSGVHDLEEINTYAEKGLDALWESADRLKRQFGYERLRFAYHYYEPLRELLGQTKMP